MKKLALAVSFLLMVLPVLGANYDAIFEKYFQIGSALTNDSLNDAQKAAKDLMTAIPQGDSDLKKDLSSVANLANEISTSKTLDDARKAYADMTPPMKNLKEATKADAHEYYCGMVKKSWLQKGDKVQNPYLGKAMPTCGEKKS